MKITTELRKWKGKRYEIDYERKVRVYKNLHKDCWSIKQDGLVKGHATELYLWDCAFQVNKKGRERVLAEKRKNVHAYVIGYLTEAHNISSNWDAINPPETQERVNYNPYLYETFVRTETKAPCFTALNVRADETGLTASFVPCYSEDIEGNVTLTEYR